MVFIFSNNLTIIMANPTHTRKPVILVDGSSFLFRAYHALPQLANSENFPTGTIYGVINMLRKLIRHYQPQYMAMIFDTKVKTKRHERYPAYKANRPPIPETLLKQIAPLHTIIQAMGLPLITKDGFEADDIIGTLAKYVEAHEQRCLIVTGDKDMAQLVNSHTTLYNSMSNIELDAAGVKEKFGVSPAQMVDYLALIGDTVDNIPGISKVGPKTAQKWLDTYGELSQIIEHSGEIAGKIGQNLRDHLEQLKLNLELVTIDCHVPLHLNLDTLACRDMDKPTLQHWFQILEFNTWLASLANQQTQDNSHYTTIIDLDALKKRLESLQKGQEQPCFSLDLATTGSARTAEIVGIAMSTKPGYAIYIPCAHTNPDRQQLSLSQVLMLLTPLLADQKYTIVGHNLKYTINVLKQYKIPVHAQLSDVMLMSQVLKNHQTHHDLNSLALQYLTYQAMTFKSISKKTCAFDTMHINITSQYVAERADLTLRLHKILENKLSHQPKLVELLKIIEIPLIPVLAAMEYHGVLIDAEKLLRHDQSIKQQLLALSEQAHQLADQTFNLNSPKQLSTILYEQQKLPVLKKTPAGKPSTSEYVLQQLARYHPLPKLIVSYRQLNKLHTTYTSKLPHTICEKTARIHTSYQQIGTHTGRLSSSNPNLQNIPIRSKEGRRIRQAFIAPPGHQLVAADYSQIELRIMAHLSHDKTLIHAFEQGHDVHRATASEIFAIPYEAVNQEQRQRAKAINFGLIYGMSAFGLAKQVSISIDEAKDYISRYFQRYPGVLIFMEHTRKLANQQAYVETLFGRRLQFPKSETHYQQMAHERAAINAPLQGTAADIIKLAMLKVDQWLTRHLPHVKLIMQVHDELVFEVPKADLDAAITGIHEQMMKAANLKVPLVVDIGHGQHWEIAH